MKKIILVFIFNLFLSIAAFAQSNYTESLTITTYYPAPYGVYRNLKLNPSNEPTNGVDRGVMYYNDTENMIKFRNDTTWVSMTGGGAGGSMPSGSIIMYSGAWNFDANGLGTGALAGWALCNGNNGTPNLTDRFVTSASASTELGLTAGANSYSLTLSQMPSHNHTFTTGAAGTHDHGVSASYSGQFGLQCGGCIVDQRAVSLVTTSAGSHTHAGTTDNNGTGAAIENRPAFLRLAFIMKL